MLLQHNRPSSAIIMVTDELPSDGANGDPHPTSNGDAMVHKIQELQDIIRGQVHLRGDPRCVPIAPVDLDADQKSADSTISPPSSTGM